MIQAKQDRRAGNGIPAKRLDAKASKTDDVASFLASLIDNDAFVSDMARFSTGDLTERQIRKRYHLPEEAWTKLGEDENLVSKIETEVLRRTRSGETKRERAQQYVTEVPRVMNDILMNAGASPRHRIDAGKTLNDLATPSGQTAAADTSRFVISIDLTAAGGNTIEHYSKPYKVGVFDDTDPDNIDTTTLATIAAKQNRNEGGGNDI
jgi:hypothetical protein